MQEGLKKTLNLGDFNYEPSPTPDGIETVFKPQMKLKNVRDEIYEGDWTKKGLKHGRGIMINKRGVHEGYYNKDMKNGRGRMIYFDGRVYEGEWKENLWHGNGTIDFQNGSRYEG